MKFIAVLAVICAAASVEAAPERKRTLAERKSENKAGQRVLADETYDPLLGMDDRRLADEASMSMGESRYVEENGPSSTTMRRPMPTRTDSGRWNDRAGVPNALGRIGEVPAKGRKN